MPLINDILNHYLQAINQAFGLILPDVAWLLNVLIILNVVGSALVWAFSDDEVVVQLARKIIYIGFFAWLIQNWPMLTDVLARSFMFLGFRAGGVGFPRDYVLDPGNIALRGFTASEPMMKAISDLTGPVAFFENFIQIILLSIAVAAVLIAFFVVAIQAVVSILTFKLGTLAAFVLIPFATLKPTTFIAERPLGWVVAAGVRLMILTLVVGLGDALFGRMQLDPNTLTVRQALEVALGAIVLMVLSLLATRLAGDLVAGSPTLGAGSAAIAAGGTAAVGVGAGRVAAGGYRAGRSAVTTVGSQALRMVRNAAAIKSGGATAAASTVASAGTSTASSTVASATPPPASGGPKGGSTTT
jgi:type IV secretion system protein TrbL